MVLTGTKILVSLRIQNATVLVDSICWRILCYRKLERQKHVREILTLVNGGHAPNFNVQYGCRLAKRPVAADTIAPASYVVFIWRWFYGVWAIVSMPMQKRIRFFRLQSWNAPMWWLFVFVIKKLSTDPILDFACKSYRCEDSDVKLYEVWLEQCTLVK